MSLSIQKNKYNFATLATVTCYFALRHGTMRICGFISIDKPVMPHWWIHSNLGLETHLLAIFPPLRPIRHSCKWICWQCTCPEACVHSCLCICKRTACTYLQISWHCRTYLALSAASFSLKAQYWQYIGLTSPCLWKLLIIIAWQCHYRLYRALSTAFSFSTFTIVSFEPNSLGKSENSAHI